MKNLRLVLLVLLLAVQTRTALAAPEVGLPSTSTTDGKFLGLAGVGLQTLTQQSKFFIGLANTETTFSISLFDGDLGNSWDNHDPLNSVKTEFLLYADPNRTGDPSGKTPLVTRTSDQLTDNGWADLYNGPVHAAARSYSGNYFYFVTVRWSSEAGSANEFNSFKVKAAGQLSITPGQWAFVGAPINLGSDPAFGTAGNSYNGSWDWFAYVPAGVSQVNFTECDADARTGTPAGSPPDDETDARVVIPPDVRFSVLNQGGSLVINQTIPSGNSVCKTASAAVAASGGVYRWSWVGVDAHNLIFVDLAYETFQTAQTPLAVGTASPTPSPTATNTPINTPTGTPGPTNTPAPPPPTMTPTRTPQPSSGGGEPARPTNTPAPLLTPRVAVVGQGSVTAVATSPTAVASPATAGSPSPAASPTPAGSPSPLASPVRPAGAPTAAAGTAIQIPRALPRTGDLAPVGLGLGALMLLGAGMRFRRRG